MAHSYLEDTVKVAQAILPALAKSIKRQRAEYYCFAGYTADEVEYPVFQQIEGNINI